MSNTGRYLTSLVALFTITAPFIFDWNETHIYNPTWPGHAKFHNGQTMSLGVYLGVLTLYYTWRSSPRSPSSSSTSGNASASQELDDLFTAALVAEAYWATQLAAWFFPDVTAADPPMDPEYFFQFYILSVASVLIAAGYWVQTMEVRKVKEG